MIPNLLAMVAVIVLFCACVHQSDLGVSAMAAFIVSTHCLGSHVDLPGHGRSRCTNTLLRRPICATRRKDRQ